MSTFKLMSRLWSRNKFRKYLIITIAVLFGGFPLYNFIASAIQGNLSDTLSYAYATCFPSTWWWSVIRCCVRGQRCLSVCCCPAFGSGILCMAIKLLCIGVLFYGIAMLILRLSGSATMAVLALLLYELLNEFAVSDAFVYYKVYGRWRWGFFARAMCRCWLSPWCVSSSLSPPPLRPKRQMPDHKIQPKLLLLTSKIGMI